MARDFLASRCLETKWAANWGSKIIGDPCRCLKIALPQRTEAAPASGVTRQAGNNSAPVQWKAQETHICKYFETSKIAQEQKLLEQRRALLRFNYGFEVTPARIVSELIAERGEDRDNYGDTTPVWRRRAVGVSPTSFRNTRFIWCAL
jgi:hypothetical protein